MMKKTIFTLSLLVSLTTVLHAQTAIKETREEVADVMVFQDELLLFTKKENSGQYIYGEKRSAAGTAHKDATLNAGLINSIIGSNAASHEIFVYQKRSRKDEKIVIYSWRNDGFERTAERPLPKMVNHSYNLGLFMTEDMNSLFISADLGKTHGYDDLYLSKWEGNQWSKPKNLGKKINTRQAEFAPFVANDSLFFARKSGEEAFIYAVPLQGSAKTDTEPVKLNRNINKEHAFNAYYKKLGEQETWITAETDNNAGEATLTAYVSNHYVETPKQLAQPVIMDQTIVMPTKAKVAEPIVKQVANAAPVSSEAVRAGFQLSYDLNQIFPDDGQLKALEQFLSGQQKGTSIKIVGYSDATGSQEAKMSVSQKRAQQIKWYIDKYFTAKGFITSIETSISEEVGETARKAELYCQ